MPVEPSPPDTRTDSALRRSLFLLVGLFVSLLGAETAHAQQDDWFGADKLKHLAASTAISAGATALGGLVFESDGAAAGVGVALTVGVGGLKEWSDSRGGGTGSWRDMTWNLIGAALGSTVVYLIQRTHQASVEPAPTPALSHRTPSAATEPTVPVVPRLHAR